LKFENDQFYVEVSLARNYWSS